jgi:hypothetical protein
MGASVAKNVASEITKITTKLSNSIDVSANYISNVTQSVDIECYVDGDVKVKAVQKNIAKATQLSKLMTDSSITNNINQQMLQTAISKVGAMGIGYADANNAATAFCDVSNSVISSVAQSVTEIDLASQTFECGPQGRINGNVDIDFLTDNSFLGNQTSASKQINNISDTVTQDISQKATATVEGIGIIALMLFLMLGMVVIIIFAGGSKAKPGQNGDKGKARGAASFAQMGTVGGVLILILIILFIWGYVAKAQPFFSDPPYGSPNASSPVGNCEDGLVDIQTRTLYLKKPPLRYAYNLLNRGANGSLLELAILQLAGTLAGANGGLNVANLLLEGTLNNPVTWKRDDTFNTDKGIPPLPNLLRPYYLWKTQNVAKIPAMYIGDVANDSSSCIPGGFSCGLTFDCGVKDEHIDCNGNQVVLTNSSGEDPGSQLAVPNTMEWYKYMTPEGKIDPKRAAHARFILSRELGIPTDVYVDDDEEVTFKDAKDQLQTGPGKNYGGQAMKLGKFTTWDYMSSINSSADLTGKFGVCNTRLYQTQKNFHDWGIAVVVGIIVSLFIGFVVKSIINMRKASNTQKK